MASVKEQQMSNERTIVTKTLTFTLTETEIANRGRDAADTRSELTEIMAEFEEIKQDFKGRIGAREAMLTSLLRTIKRGTEERTVECEMVKDFDRMTVQYVFNGAIMEERAMTIEERQPSLLNRRHESAAQVD
jgi:hypothetical protein